MSRKRDVLEQLKREELIAAVDRFDLPVHDRRVRGALVEALAGSRKVGITAILEELSRNRLKDLCRTLDLDDSGREKAVLIARLAGDPPTASSPSTVRTVAEAAPASLVTRYAADQSAKNLSEGKRLPLFEQAFKNIDDVLRKEAGCTTELDYTEQTSWLLFLKYLDGLEEERAMEAQLEGKKYAFILDEPYRWERWAAPKTKAGQIDHNNAMTGDDLRDFVNLNLFPYLHAFKQKASGPNTIEYKVGEIFGEIKNKIQSGYNLREIIDHIDELRFRSQTEKHELSHLYEAKIRNMGNAGRNGGEYYTPRPLIRAMVQVVQPKIGETIYDGACGSAGFLCESFEYLKANNTLTTKDLKTLQECTFFGKEKKSLAYVIAIMNMILHGIDAPNILHTNTLTENLADIQEKDRFDVILANPPFGGKERKEVQQNFPIRTGETAFLFLQHFIKMLRAGKRAGVVIKNTFLSNTDNASVGLRKMLLESCNLHTVLDCPSGTFQGAGVKTVVLFFEKGRPTSNIWHYQLDPGRNLGKTNPLNDADLAEFVKLQRSKADSPKSWSVDVKNIDKATFDLSVKNPSGGEGMKHRNPQAIIEEIAALDAESTEVLRNIRTLL